MTDTKTLIEDTREWIQIHRDNRFQREAARRMGLLLDALEAAEQRVESAERQVQIRADDSIAARVARQNVRAVEEWVRVNQERDALAAVVEKVREAIRYGSRMDAHPTRMPTGSVQDSEIWWASWHARADEAWRRNMTDALAAAPADALREHDAALIEGLASDYESDPDVTYFPTIVGRWLREKARQRREEQS